MHVHAGTHTRTYTQEKSQNDTFSSFNWHQISKFHKKKKIIINLGNFSSSTSTSWHKSKPETSMSQISRFHIRATFYLMVLLEFYIIPYSRWGLREGNLYKPTFQGFIFIQLMPNLHIYKISSTGKIFTWKMEC